MAFIPHALLLIGAYLVGSIPFAIVSSRVFGLSDPRSYGSGNPGATNVLRSGSKAAAALTLLGDCLKGWLVVWAAQALGFDTATAALAGLAAFIGHVFSVFLRFKGGKGVATALGVIAGLDLHVALSCLGVWLLVVLISRYSSAAALAAALVAPIVAHFVSSGNAAITLVILTISAILIWRHTANIRRLLAGTEEKIGGRKNPEHEE
ncbi:MAG: glycerol-3-phosphate 1-O-acyltransferase PlsY [Proteobacteria bacterium]|jgi:glycerol-3-phosphate acyltransferase PlsY|nr:glycerol-3-phosphate 1-O-acyltransferase PlsY [Pseudomonadota bacterium]